jgi:spermidine synthase
MASKFGTILVFDEGAYRCFSFNKLRVVQSCVHRRRSLDFRYEYVRLMFVGSVMTKSVKRAAVLGLGGAALPRLLSAYHPAAAIDVVEIDPGVVRMAKRYFRYQPSGRTRIHVEDAADFVYRSAKGKARYDLIMFDCFGPDFIPKNLLTERFIRTMGDLLARGGVLAVNVWGGHRKYRAIVRLYGRLFPHLWIVKGKSGNHVLLASHRPAFASMSALVERARRFDRDRKPVFSVRAQLSKMVRYRRR